MTKRVKDFLSTWWKVLAIAGTALLFVVRASADVIELLNTPEQIKALEAQDSVIIQMIDDMASTQKESLQRNERRLDQFGFVLCDVLD